MVNRELSEHHFKECFGDLSLRDKENLRGIIEGIEKITGLGKDNKNELKGGLS